MDQCDYCNDPVFDVEDMGSHLSKLCERHYYKSREMAHDAMDEEET